MVVAPALPVTVGRADLLRTAADQAELGRPRGRGAVFCAVFCAMFAWFCEVMALGSEARPVPFTAASAVYLALLGLRGVFRAG